MVGVDPGAQLLGQQRRTRTQTLLGGGGCGGAVIVGGLLQSSQARRELDRHLYDELTAAFGLIQEHLHHNLYSLLVQSILWNQTSSRSARPILDTILDLYLDPASLMLGSLPELILLLRLVRFYNIHSTRLITLVHA